MAEKILIANIKGPKGDIGKGLPTGGNTGDVLIKKSNDDLDYDWLDLDASADFLTENGFGKLRYYNNKFQYYDNNTSSWIDTIPTLDNSAIIQIAPNFVKRFIVVCNPDTLNVEIKLEEPNDIIIDNQPLSLVEKVVVRRKKDSFPINENDGDHIFTVNRNEFGKYKDSPFIDVVNGDIDDVYYYKAFPIGNNGIVNYMEENNHKCKIKNYQLYGFRIDQNEGAPNSMIQYLEDVDNVNFKSAYMDYTNNKFNYGDWEEAWFIKRLRPCMLKYDGTVAYDLDKNDYSKKTDGSPSDITLNTFEGNVMVGIPKTYWKIVDNGDDTADVYFSDKKLDDDYVCWCNINEVGEEIDYFYMSAYNSYYADPRIRSLSGKVMDGNHYFSTDVSRAKANNIEGQHAWTLELFVDRMLINLLLLLIGKSTNTQTVFGAGLNEVSGNTGILNNKGMFYGKNTFYPVKIFGIENFWGNKYRYGHGIMLIDGIPKVKLTHGTSDGSTEVGYNLTGKGYVTIEGVTKVVDGYVNKLKFFNNIYFPCETVGTATTKYCDYYNASNAGTRCYITGGCQSNTHMGAFYQSFAYTTSGGAENVGSALSCKPLNQTPQEV